MKKPSDPQRHYERELALFLLGVLLFNPPLLTIASVPRLILGVPLLYLFLFVGWGLLIVLVALHARRDPDRMANGDDGKG